MRKMHASIPRSIKAKQAKQAALVDATTGAAMRRNHRGIDLMPNEESRLPGKTLLTDVVNSYLADAKRRLSPSTWQPYESHLGRLVELLQTRLSERASLSKRKAGAPTLAEFTAANIRPVIEELQKEHLYDARGKAIAARALGTYLAEAGLWFVGHRGLPLSVLCKLEIPKARAKGRPTYNDDELITIREAASVDPRRPYMQGALQLFGELGLRPGFETMLLRRADVHLPRFPRDRGYVEIKEETSKTENGARQIPLEPDVVLALDAYLRLERPPFQGKDAENEPFFLTEDGLPFAYPGWNSMRQRFRRRVARLEPTFKYQASRNRGTRTAKLRENDYGDSEIMQLQGWTTHGMIRRYAGDIPRKDLERKPLTTSLRPGKLRRVS